MSDYEDVVEELTNEAGVEYRVRLEPDDSGEKPYDDGATPILQLKTGYWNDEFNVFNTQANGFEEKYEELHGRVDNSIEVFERYLRIFHGTRSFHYSDSENYRYVAFDTAAWREEHLDENWCLSNPMEAVEVAKGSLTEVISWANGEVYGYIVEKNVAEEDDYPEWVSVDDGTCWGFYGRDWAEQAAKEELELAAKHKR